jgi:hypothetical protein
MPQAVKISTNVISGSINKNGVSFNIEGAGRNFGSLDGGNWYSNVLPDDGRWVIISESKGSGKPAFWLTAGSADSDLLTTVNGLPSRYNLSDFTATGSALDYLVQNDYMVLRAVPDQSDADSVLLEVDAKNLSSYPRTGNIWGDISGYASTQVLYNSPPFNDAGYLDFSTDEYSVRSVGVLTLGNDYTISATVNILNSVGNFRTLVRTSPDDHPILIREGNNDLGYYANGDGEFRDSGYDIVAGRWMRLDAVGTNGNQQQFYVNGEAVGVPVSSAGGFNATGMNWNTLGNIGGGGSQPFGKVANCTVYNKALSVTELKQNYFGGPIVTDGLVFAVDASNLVSYENGSTTTYQLTGSANNGTLYNGTEYLPDNGGVWEFDGTNDYIEFTSGISTPTANLTTVTWVKLDSYLAQNSTIGIHPDGGVNGGVRIYATSPTSLGVWMRNSGGGAPSISTSNGIPLNEWTQITFVNNNGVGKIYKNGVEVLSSTFSSTPVALNNVNAWISRFSGGGYYIDGKVGSTMLYNRALTPEEVGQNYNAQKQKFQK